MNSRVLPLPLTTRTQAAAAQAKNRCDLIIALTAQGKTAEEIAEFLELLGL